MIGEPALRVGVVSPTETPSLVADIEAAVLRHELRSRLGATVLVIGAPTATGVRSSDGCGAPVDLTVAADHLWGPEAPPLSPALGRTVDPLAAAVRERMLRHLGVLAGSFVLDDDYLDRVALPLDALDFWIVARAADRVELTHPVLAAIRDEGSLGAIDAAIDRAVEFGTWSDHDGRDVRLAALTAERDRALTDLEAARARFAEHERVQVETLDRLEREVSELRQRLERAPRP